MVKKKYNLSKKQNVSELLNSSKTKKNYKITNKKRQISNLEQSGGKTSQELSDTKIKEVSHKYYIVAKQKYKFLKYTIKFYLARLWIASKNPFDKFSTEEYKLTKSYFYMQLYIARIGLVYNKLNNIVKNLISDKNSIVLKIRKKIRKIFELQNEISSGDIRERTGLSLMFKGKRNELAIIKKQDKLRKKIIKYTVFKNNKELSKNCKTAIMGRTAQVAAVGTLGLSALAFGTGSGSINKKKGLICILGKYRKYEAKFNKYYKKISNYNKQFTRDYELCDGLINGPTINYLDVEQMGKGTNSRFDKTKCDDINRLKSLEESLKKAANLADKKTKDKFTKDAKEKQDLDKNFLKKAKDFNKTTVDFNKKLDAMVDVFNKCEAFGIHHYKANISKHRSIMKFISKKIIRKEEKISVDEVGLNALCKNSTFIDDFTNLIDSLEKDSKNLMGDMKFEEVIPNIYIDVNKLANLKVMSINFANMKYGGVDEAADIYNSLQLDKNIGFGKNLSSI